MMLTYLTQYVTMDCNRAGRTKSFLRTPRNAQREIKKKQKINYHERSEYILGDFILLLQEGVNMGVKKKKKKRFDYSEEFITYIANHGYDNKKHTEHLRKSSKVKTYIDMELAKKYK